MKDALHKVPLHHADLLGGQFWKSVWWVFALNLQLNLEHCFCSSAPPYDYKVFTLSLFCLFSCPFLFLPHIFIDKELLILLLVLFPYSHHHEPCKRFQRVASRYIFRCYTAVSRYGSRLSNGRSTSTSSNVSFSRLCLVCGHHVDVMWMHMYECTRTYGCQLCVFLLVQPPRVIRVVIVLCSCVVAFVSLFFGRPIYCREKKTERRHKKKCGKFAVTKRWWWKYCLWI